MAVLDYIWHILIFGGGVYTVANPSHWHEDWDAARLMAAHATNSKHSAQKSPIRKPGLVIGRFVYY